MPEIRECIAHYLCMLWFFGFCLREKLDLQLLALWADASEKEEKKLAPDGLVYRLDASSTVVRGNANAQTSLWPGPFKKTKANPDPPSIRTLKLKGVSYSNRTIILDMGPLHFQLAYLTHTSIQFFSKETWENTVTKTHKKTRKYYIGLAFEFSNHVVAFLSLDQVFQPHWACSQMELPEGPVDVYTSYEQFLSNVADWIRKRANSSSDRLGLACEVMRINGNKVWSGFGVYSSSEVFHDSGNSPLSTEREIFDSPSRTARLCESLWSYAHKSHSEKMR
ncbi:hypothetical protein GALMADRAFT_765703 [Galerina marginata CBS 339.88]|uniref:Uncharacterized protein n=1 Tax=Galerina marginata (strain CBS 339.88) TaxID=685588 RepID=A0A067SZH8_GALM3|nr:hypothetical protein GALMADRAFT_765703 [Galerina marginata CBS 339.88]